LILHSWSAIPDGDCLPNPFARHCLKQSWALQQFAGRDSTFWQTKLTHDAAPRAHLSLPVWNYDWCYSQLLQARLPRCLRCSFWHLGNPAPFTRAASLITWRSTQVVNSVASHADSMIISIFIHSLIVVISLIVINGLIVVIVLLIVVSLNVVRSLIMCYQWTRVELATALCKAKSPKSWTGIPTVIEIVIWT
jgi:hypothetical protein